MLEVSQFRVFRMFRVIRILRVFGRMSSLRHIINSIGHSLLPLLDALFLVVMVLAMFALIGASMMRLVPRLRWRVYSLGCRASGLGLMRLVPRLRWRGLA